MENFKEWELIFIGHKEIFIGQRLFSDAFLREITQLEEKYGSVYYTNNQEEFFDKLDKFNAQKYCFDWKEISEERHWEMLECLPPECYNTFKGWNIFRMCEYTTGDITSHFMEKNWKFYEGSFDINWYKDILELIK